MHLGSHGRDAQTHLDTDIGLMEWLAISFPAWLQSVHDLWLSHVLSSEHRQAGIVVFY
jgi:hypothetical protein